MITKTKHRNAVIAVYKSHGDAEACIQELQHSGFDMKQLSIIGRDYHTDEHVAGYYNTGDRVDTGELKVPSGEACGAGSLARPSWSFLASVPWCSPGPVVGWIIGALEGAVVVGGLSALGACLYSQGIPKNSVLKFETALRTGKFIVIAHGTAEEADHARAVMDRSPAEASEQHPTAAREVLQPLVTAVCMEPCLALWRH